MRSPNRRVMVAGSIVVVVVAATVAVIAARAPGKSRSSGSSAPATSAHRLGGIAGRVTDPSGHPVAGVRVDLYAAGASQPVGETSSAIDGTFTQANLTPGTYALYYFASSALGGWLSGWYKSAASQAQAVPVDVSLAKTVRVDIVLQHAATITGKVTDPAGHPVAGVSVWAYVAGTPDIAWEAQSGPDGSYSDVNLATGSYDLYYFSPTGWKSGWYKGATSEAGATHVNAVAPSIASGIDISLQPKS